MLKISKTILILLLLTIIGCSNREVKYSNSIISSPHPLASEAGRQIYSMGGNAFDAAVASAFALSVVEPSMSGIGGRIQVIFKTQDGVISGIDGTTQIPQSFYSDDDLPSFGYKTIGIPGVVAGLLMLHEENGQLDLETIMQPAIKYAEDGFMLLPGEILRQKYEKDKLESFEGSKIYFLDSIGNSFDIGDRIIQKDLANTFIVLF